MTRAIVVILAGVLGDGVLLGPLNAPGLFTINLGEFVLPPEADDTIFNMMDPSSAQLAMNLSAVKSSNGQTFGLVVDSGVLQSFTADAMLRFEAEPIPEPKYLVHGDNWCSRDPWIPPTRSMLLVIVNPEQPINQFR